MIEPVNVIAPIEAPKDISIKLAILIFPDEPRLKTSGFKKADMATPVLKCDEETIRALKKDRSQGLVGGTTAVFDKNNKALYFSKEVTPYSNNKNTEIFHHVGIYAYKPKALKEYINWPTGPLEEAEGLEQLRFLENGGYINCVEVDGRGRDFWEVNNPSDVPKVNSMLQKLGIS